MATLHECRSVQPMERVSIKLAMLLRIHVGEDTVESVRQRLGGAELVRGSESDGSRMCYRFDAPGHAADVAFEFGPLGGLHYVTGYRVSRSSRETEGDCLPLSGSQVSRLRHRLQLYGPIAKIPRSG